MPSGLPLEDRPAHAVCGSVPSDDRSRLSGFSAFVAAFSAVAAALAAARSAAPPDDPYGAEQCRPDQESHYNIPSVHINHPPSESERHSGQPDEERCRPGNRTLPHDDCDGPFSAKFPADRSDRGDTGRVKQAEHKKGGGRQRAEHARDASRR